MTSPRILFSPQDEWGPTIRGNAGASGYEIVMRHLAEANLGAFDAVVPLSLGCQEIVRRRMSAGEFIPALVPSRAVEALCNDKLAFNRAAIRTGFGECIPKLLPGIPDQAEDYPVILKPCQDEWGKRSRVVFSKEQAETLLAKNPDAFLQEYIRGFEECAAHILLRDGEILFTATMCYSWSGGTPYVQGQHNRPPAGRWLSQTPALEVFAELLHRIGFRDGTCCIDFRLVNGMPRIFEINPRFGGSLMHRTGDYLDVYTQAARASRKAA